MAAKFGEAGEHHQDLVATRRCSTSGSASGHDRRNRNGPTSSPPNMCLARSRPTEREQAEALIRSNPDLPARLVQTWERRLGRAARHKGPFGRAAAHDLGAYSGPASTAWSRAPPCCCRIPIRLRAPRRRERSVIDLSARLRPLAPGGGRARRGSACRRAGGAGRGTEALRPDALPGPLRPKPGIEIVKTIETPVNPGGRFVAVLQGIRPRRRSS